MLPLVSVIVPNYNHAAYLYKRLRSVLDQTYTNFECIVLDDASTDNSVEIIQDFLAKDERISFIASDKNSGSPFIQWNKGVQLAKGAFIWIAESDDVADTRFLETMVKQLDENPAAALAYCQSYKMDSSGNITGSWLEWTDDMDADLFKADFKMNGIPYIERFLVNRNTIPNASAVVFRKAVYNEIQGANETIPTSSDWLTWLKMLLNYNLVFVAKSLNFFRYHQDSVIAKAHTRESKVYEPEFDYAMRSEFDNYLLLQNGGKLKNVKKLNDQFIYHAIGNHGLYNYKNGNKLKGLSQIIQASVYPEITISYIKRLLFTKSLRK